MAKGYKVRLGDGSEIGPMDIDTLRGWYVQGLISRESPVMLPGSSRWTTLGETSEIRSFRSGEGRPSSPPRPAPSARPGARPAGRQSRPASPASRRPTAAPSWWEGKPWGLILGSVGLLVAGGAAYVVLGPSAEERAIRGFALSEKRVVDEATGVTIDAPAPWVVLRKEQNLVGVPAEAKAVLAHPKKGAFAYVLAERGPSTAEAYLEEIVESRKQTVPGLAESGRSDRTVGKATLRQSLATFESAGKRFQGVTLAGQEGGTAFALVGWEPAEAGGAEEIQRLADGLSVVPPRIAGLDEAIQVVSREVPFLTSAAARQVMAQSAAQVLEPDETFRRSLQYMGMGLASLGAKEQRELGELNRTLYGLVPQRDRWRMAAYIDRVRNRASTAPQDNKRYRELMRDAVLKLPAPKQARLRQLYEQAILKGLGLG